MFKVSNMRHVVGHYCMRLYMGESAGLVSKVNN